MRTEECQAWHFLREALEKRIVIEGLRPFALNCQGVEIGQIRSVTQGRPPKATTIQALCDALGLEFYIGLPRQIALNLLPISDQELAQVIAVLADEYEELNLSGREALLTRFWHFHPDLAQRCKNHVGQRLLQLNREKLPDTELSSYG